MEKIDKLRQGNQTIWFDKTAFSSFEPLLFDPEWLRGQGKLIKTSQGRNQAFFLSHEGTEMVLRHYFRGGMIGRFNKDFYLRQEVSNSRAMQEFTLLEWMHGKDLPVPRPLAARHSSFGLVYKADLITQAIPNATPLANILGQQALSEETWAEIGRAIARIHNAGVNHTDLNCRNILLDTQLSAWIIDFDKCMRQSPGAWSQNNLTRLKRSFDKERTKIPNLNWTLDDWAALTRGYHG